MKIHEYQSRAFLNDYGIAIAQGGVALAAENAPALFDKFANPSCVAKVQVLMGGRGKAGGVRKVSSSAEARSFCEQFLGKPFSTSQSGGEAKTVRAVLITEDISIRAEYYLAVTVDRARQSPVILFSREGGVDIEEVAAKSPEVIHKIYFRLAAPPNRLEIEAALSKSIEDRAVGTAIADIAVKLARLFVEKDVSLCEINPLVLADSKRVLALDAKIVFDDNALFRHEDIRALKDPEEEDEKERKAKDFGLNYVSMNGCVGCLVNGAGLAMATMDMIQLAGGAPANFLDVGGGATADQVREGFKIILQDTRVRAIFVNIFGGIMKCDVIAEGVLQASKEIRLQVPLVVRLEGTRVEEGRRLLQNSGLKIYSRPTIQEAAETAVRLAEEIQKTRAHSHR